MKLYCQAELLLQTICIFARYLKVLVSFSRVKWFSMSDTGFSKYKRHEWQVCGWIKWQTNPMIPQPQEMTNGKRGCSDDAPWSRGIYGKTAVLTLLSRWSIPSLASGVGIAKQKQNYMAAILCSFVFRSFWGSTVLTLDFLKTFLDRGFVWR